MILSIQTNIAASRTQPREPGRLRSALPESDEEDQSNGSQGYQSDAFRGEHPLAGASNAEPEFPVTPEAEFYREPKPREIKHASVSNHVQITVSSALGSEEKSRLLSQARHAARVSRGTYNGLGEFPAIGLAAGTFDSYWKVDTALRAETKLKVKEYDVCPTGCLAYIGTYENWERNKKCPICDKLRVRGVSAVARYLPMMHGRSIMS